MFCLDTYALVEIARGNENFKPYFEEPFVVPDVILAEFYGIQLRVDGEATADYWFNKLKGSLAETPIELLINAVKFRYRNKGKNLSFFDAVGYAFAKKNNLLFVTGDSGFEGLPGVRFVKK
ncbi:PIN domain-containing protein [Candidatus Woesearchaeota archaeon]|nr:PIN domain-containing protein [Candidatus Woesearchaeota archaeon]